MVKVYQLFNTLESAIHHATYRSGSLSRILDKGVIMSFINPITDLNLTYTLDENTRHKISQSQEAFEEFFDQFITGIQNKLEHQTNLSLTETEFVMNLLTDIYDNGYETGLEHKEIDDEIEWGFLCTF